MGKLIRVQSEAALDADSVEGTESRDIIDALPFGVAVLDAQAALLFSNPAVARLLGVASEPSAGERWCCMRLGCGSGVNPLGEHCLTELALAESEPLPEMRIDLDHTRPRGAVWATAARMQPHEDRVIVHLRPAGRGDRRRRTNPHWTRGSELRVVSLGRLEVESPEGPLTGRWLAQRPGRLLKFLLTDPARGHTSEEIAEALWPNDGARGLNSLRHTVHILRQRLEPDREGRASASFVLRRHGRYFLDRGRVHLDVDLFEQHIRTGAAAFMSGADAVAVESLTQGLDLYAGDFLAEDPYLEWAFAERDRLRALAAQAHRMLGELHIRTGDLSRATERVRSLTNLEPWDEESQQALLIILLRRGRRTEAVRHFALYRARVQRDFGEEPGFGLSDLSERSVGQLRLV